MSDILKDCCGVIWEVLKPDYVRAPSSVAEGEGVSRDFEHLWNFPHCIGMVHNGKTLVNIIYY